MAGRLERGDHARSSAPRAPPEVIRDLLGYQDTKTAIRYLALRNDDGVSAMRVLDQARPPLRSLGHEAG